MVHQNMIRSPRRGHIGLLTVIVGITVLVVLLLTTTTQAQPLPDAIRDWTAVTSLPETLDSEAAVTVGDWLYVLGGLHGEQPTATVRRTRINADGSLGAWQATTPLPVALDGHAAVAHNGRVYVIGGYQQRSVYMASVHADGSLGAWQALSQLPNARFTAGAVVLNNTLYVLGGFDANPLPGVWRAPIGADGILGAWVQDRALPTPLYRLNAVVTNNAIYVIGGRPTTSTVSRKIYRAVRSNGGALENWVEMGSDILPEARADAVSLVAQRKLFVIGGTDGSQARSSVISFDIRPDGPLMPLAPGAALPAARLRAAGALSQGQDLYVIGGRADANTQTDTVFRARVVSEVFMPQVRHQFTPAPTRTPTSTNTPTNTPTPTPTLTPRPTNTPTRTPTNTPTNTPTPTVPSQSGADLVITKSADRATVTPSGRIRYTIVVTNNGPQAAVNLVVIDTLPAQVEPPVATPIGCTRAGPQIRCTQSLLNSGQAMQIEFTVTVFLAATGTLTNQVDVSSDTADPNLSNNHAQVDVVVT